MSHDRGWEFLTSSEGNFDINKDNDGSWGGENFDGSFDFYGSDGSHGHREADGSMTYQGADGSYGSVDSSGAGSYSGNDGSYGYIYADGSSCLYDSNGHLITDDDTYFGSSSGGKGSALGTLFTLGLIAYGISQSNKASRERKNESKELDRKIKEIEQLARSGQTNTVEGINAGNTSRPKGAKYYWDVITNKKLEAGMSSLSCEGSSSELVIKHFEKQGFYNITTDIIEDLSTTQLRREGKVHKVTIDKIDCFDSTTLFPVNAKINIVLHKLRREKPPFTSNGARGRRVQDVVEQFHKAGFINVYPEPILDLRLGWLKKDGAIESISIGGVTDFRRSAKFRLDEPVTILYHTFPR